MEAISILLVDDHKVVRSGLKTLLDLQPDLQVVGEASDGNEAFDQALSMKPNIIIMDITMPVCDGLEATRKIRTEWPEATILALTVHDDKQYFLEMLTAGAAGYLTKSSAPTELVQAIRTVAKGQTFLQPALARWLLDDYQKMAWQPRTQTAELEGTVGIEVLSDREREVLEMVANGLNSPEIGKRLGLSPKTISRHRERIMAKLNMHSRTELVKFAIRCGLVKVD